MIEATALLALFFGFSAFCMSVYAIIVITAMNWSTHRVEYVHDQPLPQFAKDAADLTEQPSQFDNIKAFEDDFDIDKQGI